MMTPGGALEVSMRLHFEKALLVLAVFFSAATLSAQQIGKYVPVSAGSDADRAIQCCRGNLGTAKNADHRKQSGQHSLRAASGLQWRLPDARTRQASRPATSFCEDFSGFGIYADRSRSRRLILPASPERAENVGGC